MGFNSGFKGLMFISIPTNGRRSSTKLILKLFWCSYTIHRDLTSFVTWTYKFINLLAPKFLHLIQTNHQPDATVFQFIILTFVYSPTGFGRFPAHHQELNDCSGSLWVLPSYRGDSRANTAQHLMMGGKTPETCWAVNKLQDNKLKNCCIRLVIYLNCTMMHGLTNLKFYI